MPCSTLADGFNFEEAAVITVEEYPRGAQYDSRVDKQLSGKSHTSSNSLHDSLHSMDLGKSKGKSKTAGSDKLSTQPSIPDTAFEEELRYKCHGKAALSWQYNKMQLACFIGRVGPHHPSKCKQAHAQLAADYLPGYVNLSICHAGKPSWLMHHVFKCRPDAHDEGWITATIDPYDIFFTAQGNGKLSRLGRGAFGTVCPNPGTLHLQAASASAGSAPVGNPHNSVGTKAYHSFCTGLMEGLCILLLPTQSNCHRMTSLNSMGTMLPVDLSLTFPQHAMGAGMSAPCPGARARSPQAGSLVRFGTTGPLLTPPAPACAGVQGHVLRGTRGSQSVPPRQLEHGRHEAVPEGGQHPAGLPTRECRALHWRVHLEGTPPPPHPAAWLP